jgi:TetR/AcrR family transcriptional regulator
MALERRRGRKDSKTRSRLIDEALKLLAEEGVAALTARRLAQRLELSFQIVHYYFKSMDDLLIAVIGQSIVAVLESLKSAALSDNPLSALIELHRGPASVAMGLEFEIYANRRPAVREAVKRYIDLFRQAELDVVSSHLKLHDLDEDLPSLAMTVIITSACRVLALEDGIGVTQGHEEALAWLGNLLHLPAIFSQQSRPPAAHATSLNERTG